MIVHKYWQLALGSIWVEQVVQVSFLPMVSLATSGAGYSSQSDPYYSLNLQPKLQYLE